MPQSFESLRTNKNIESSNVNDQLGNLKQQIKNSDKQTNIKVDETIDTFNEQL